MRQNGVELQQQGPWKNTGFLSRNVLTEHNALFCFCDQLNTQFYDIRSDNAVILMQNPHLPLMPNGQDEMEQKLKLMTGEQYVLEVRSPPLFVIRKHKRVSPSSIHPIAYYYILDGTIDQCPDMLTLFQSRLAASMAPFGDAMAKAMENLRFNPSRGYWWEFKNAAPSASDERKQKSGGDADGGESDGDGDKNNPMNVRTTIFQRQRTDALLRALVQQFPPSKITIKYGGDDPTANKQQQQPSPSPIDISSSIDPSIPSLLQGGAAFGGGNNPYTGGDNHAQSIFDTVEEKMQIDHTTHDGGGAFAQQQQQNFQLQQQQQQMHQMMMGGAGPYVHHQGQQPSAGSALMRLLESGAGGGGGGQQHPPPAGNPFPQHQNQ